MRQPFYSPSAKSDLREIAVYIAARNEPAAKRIISEIRQRCRTLAKRPGLGASRSELGTGVRISAVWPYLVFYSEISGGIRVERILHGARDIDAIFGDSEEEE